mmetsp:Transcript_55950/g.147964  ORF Transcript_55950/g.147964 Transcript_55950/m.147964 type:complete len:90 (+) Transcript_55950:67-336(+)
MAMAEEGSSRKSAEYGKLLSPLSKANVHNLLAKDPVVNDRGQHSVSGKQIEKWIQRTPSGSALERQIPCAESNEIVLSVPITVKLPMMD